MKGIILAGGSGSRLYPLTYVTSKQLLPIYNKPMIYYPLSVLMLAGIHEILIISTPIDIDKFRTLLGDGSNFGVKFSYKVQESPRGLAEAFILGESFIGNDSVCMILGDNIFYGNGLKNYLSKAVNNIQNGFSTVFGYHVDDPERFGVVEFDNNNKVKSIEEKPKNPKSSYAVTGLYFYTSDVVEKAKEILPSIRGELEITDLNKAYLNNLKLDVITLGRGFTWLDTGTYDSLAEATLFVKMIEEHQGLMISCPEEIAYKNGWISNTQLRIIADKMSNTKYGEYLHMVLDEKVLY